MVSNRASQIFTDSRNNRLTSVTIAALDLKLSYVLISEANLKKVNLQYTP